MNKKDDMGVKCIAMIGDINNLLTQSKFTEGQAIYVLGSLLARVLAGVKDYEDATEKTLSAIKEASKDMRKEFYAKQKH